MSSLSACNNVADLKRLARARLPRPMFDYIEGGADDEVTVGRNERSFEDLELLPRLPADVSRVDASTEVMGAKIPMPIILAPTGMTRLFHHEGEVAVARAAAAAGTLYCLSTMGSTSIEQVAQVSDGPKCFQIYPFKDRELVREFIDRARAAGYTSICLTVDVTAPGHRERDLRNGMTVPPSFDLAGILSVASRPRWCWNYLSSPAITMANVVHRRSVAGVSALAEYVAGEMNPGLTWDDVAWMAETWGGPFAIKGLLAPQDARRAVEAGARTIIVSNHGGRQLDGAASSVRALPDIADAIGGTAEIVLDSGIRRGSHVLKALALGANACMIGRPYLYGLAAAGEAGVTRLLNLFRTEIERDMALLGVARLSEIGRQHLLGLSPICGEVEDVSRSSRFGAAR